MSIDSNSPASRDPRREDAQAQNFFEQMRDFVRRNLNWFLAIGLALLLLQDVFGAHGVLAMRRSMKDVKNEQQQINKLNDENHHLQDRVKSLKSDPEAIERIAREDMGLARPGEYIFKIPTKADDASAAPSSSSPSVGSSNRR